MKLSQLLEGEVCIKAFLSPPPTTRFKTVNSTMGLLVSKPDPSPCMKGNSNCDDCQSRATAQTSQTEDSSSVVVRHTHRSSGSNLEKVAPDVTVSSKMWRAGSQSTPDFAHVPRRNTHSGGRLSNNPHILLRRDSDPGMPKRATEPVKCPPRQSQVASSNFGLIEQPPEEEDAVYLRRVYDTRTWDMYRRITEARKQSNFVYDARQSTATARPANPRECTSEWENLQHEEYAAADHGIHHEMIFLFEFD